MSCNSAASGVGNRPTPIIAFLGKVLNEPRRVSLIILARLLLPTKFESDDIEALKFCPTLGGSALSCSFLPYCCLLLLKLLLLSLTTVDELEVTEVAIPAVLVPADEAALREDSTLKGFAIKGTLAAEELGSKLPAVLTDFDETTVFEVFG